MKKIFKTCVIALFAIFALVGCGNKADKNWYEGMLKYYQEGFDSGWKTEAVNLPVSEEEKDPNKKFGYLLRDLNGDGIDELLIGIIDNEPETKFVAILINHSDFGPNRSFTAGDGYYMYICDNNVIRVDSWYGSETKTEYMTYNDEGDSFLVVDGGSKPQKITLTPF